MKERSKRKRTKKRFRESKRGCVIDTDRGRFHLSHTIHNPHLNTLLLQTPIVRDNNSTAKKFLLQWRSSPDNNRPTKSSLPIASLLLSHLALKLLLCNLDASLDTHYTKILASTQKDGDGRQTLVRIQPAAMPITASITNPMLLSESSNSWYSGSLWCTWWWLRILHWQSARLTTVVGPSWGQHLFLEGASSHLMKVSSFPLDRVSSRHNLSLRRWPLNTATLKQLGSL